jgi:hypothetical protein
MGRSCVALLILALGSACSRSLAPTGPGTGGRGGSAPPGGLSGRAGAPGTGAARGEETGIGGGAQAGIGGGGDVTGIGAGSGGGPVDGGARDGGASFCSIPGAPQAGWTDITVTWCDAGRACASCVWTTGAYGIGLLAKPDGPCAFPAMLCPVADSQSIAAGGIFPVCTAHPDGEVYEGVLVQLVGVTLSPAGVTQATACAGLDNEGSGNLPDFNFDVTPCGLDHFTCVADCSACP